MRLRQAPPYWNRLHGYDSIEWRPLGLGRGRLSTERLLCINNSSTHNQLLLDCWGLTGKVTVGLASHWAHVTLISGSSPTGSRPGRGRWALTYAGSMENHNRNWQIDKVIFPLVLWHCWLGVRKGIQPIKVVLVCWWWHFDWSFAHLIAPVVITT